jgi:hypothetical protein
MVERNAITKTKKQLRTTSAWNANALVLPACTVGMMKTLELATNAGCWCCCLYCRHGAVVDDVKSKAM